MAEHCFSIAVPPFTTPYSHLLIHHTNKCFLAAAVAAWFVVGIRILEPSCMQFARIIRSSQGCMLVPPLHSFPVTRVAFFNAELGAGI